MARKTVYTLCVDNYSPGIRQLTYPLLRGYAEKIDAEFYEITERRFPEWPVTYEKFQIGDLASERRDEWILFFDADTLISSDQFDITSHLSKDTVAHNAKDIASVRWRYDEYFWRDGRSIGSCSWCVVASEWCLDLWARPDVPMERLLPMMSTTLSEERSGLCPKAHLIDDYLLSRNIARFGLKFTTVKDICGSLGLSDPLGQGRSPFLWHKHQISESQKLREMLAILSTPDGELAFAESGDIISTPQGLALRIQDGRIIGPCGRGWGLMTKSEAAAFWRTWDVTESRAVRLS